MPSPSEFRFTNSLTVFECFSGKLPTMQPRRHIHCFYIPRRLPLSTNHYHQCSSAAKMGSSTSTPVTPVDIPLTVQLYINNRRRMSLSPTIPTSRCRTIEDLLQAFRTEARSYFAALKKHHSRPELMFKGIIVTLEDNKAASRVVSPDNGYEYENWVRERVENT
jgi:hypothetical protein